jgi:regulatory protein YycH of two-component signal transduction system YycFG
MSKYSEKNRVSDKTREDAMKIARGTQKPGQTKEQTKLIAQGIQKGIEEYKKRQNAKARELDKKLKKTSVSSTSDIRSSDDKLEPAAVKNNFIAWVLLIVSWLGFATYIFIKNSH